MKTKEEKVTNLNIHEKKLKRKYAIKGTAAGIALSTLPIGIAVASNVFGMDIRIQDTSVIGDVFNTAYSVIETWPVAIFMGASIITVSNAAGKDKAEEKIKQLKK